MSDLIGLAANAAGGGVFGLVGTALGRVAGFFERRQSMAHEQARWAHDLLVIEARRAADQAAAEAERDLADTAGRWAGLKASMEAEAAIGPSYRWVNAVRGLTRPVLTFLLWGISAAIWFHADAAGQSSIIETATFAATAATLWWFGDRSRMVETRTK
ncbi:MAG: hypothetical protein QNI84_07255 [Henriciella sp.]|nr:hypothetical protein [Henriciella sp.]